MLVCVTINILQKLKYELPSPMNYVANIFATNSIYTPSGNYVFSSQLDI